MSQPLPQRRWECQLFCRHLERLPARGVRRVRHVRRD
nr:MAG TPA: hypothetical protein [Caudoviricetes sp.]